ncbi:hypothetical protein FHU30_003547 [Actinomadura rupiterrae]|nr:hypothetical protein [Actinomadura rupiterrae]
MAPTTRTPDDIPEAAQPATPAQDARGPDVPDRSAQHPEPVRPGKGRPPGTPGPDAQLSSRASQRAQFTGRTRGAHAGGHPTRRARPDARPGAHLPDRSAPAAAAPGWRAAARPPGAHPFRAPDAEATRLSASSRPAVSSKGVPGTPNLARPPRTRAPGPARPRPISPAAAAPGQRAKGLCAPERTFRARDSVATCLSVCSRPAVSPEGMPGTPNLARPPRTRAPAHPRLISPAPEPRPVGQRPSGQRARSGRATQQPRVSVRAVHRPGPRSACRRTPAPTRPPRRATRRSPPRPVSPQQPQPLAGVPQAAHPGAPIQDARPDQAPDRSAQQPQPPADVPKAAPRPFNVRDSVATRPRPRSPPAVSPEGMPKGARPACPLRARVSAPTSPDSLVQRSQSGRHAQAVRPARAFRAPDSTAARLSACGPPAVSPEGWSANTRLGVPAQDARLGAPSPGLSVPKPQPPLACQRPPARPACSGRATQQPLLSECGSADASP